MVAGTGEAPCAVMAYESDNLPEEYRGDLLVTSWGDHRLERYRLRPRGASFSAEMTPVIRGGENFRPVGLALAPDGSLFMSDWVDKSYNLHSKGRVWRMAMDRRAAGIQGRRIRSRRARSASGAVLRQIPEPLRTDCGQFNSCCSSGQRSGRRGSRRRHRRLYSQSLLLGLLGAIRPLMSLGHHGRGAGKPSNVDWRATRPEWVTGLTDDRALPRGSGAILARPNCDHFRSRCSIATYSITTTARPLMDVERRIPSSGPQLLRILFY
jgi:hypothetical protein